MLNSKEINSDMNWTHFIGVFKRVINKQYNTTASNYAPLSGSTIEIEKLDKNPKSKKASQTGGAEIQFPFDTETFRFAWNNWIEHRKNIKKPYKSLQSEQAALMALSKFNEHFALLLIQRSISNDWQGLIYEKTQQEYQSFLKNQNHVSGNNNTGPSYAEVGDAVDNYISRRYGS